MKNKKATPPKKVIVNGQQFDSITKAAFGLGIRRTEISKAIRIQNSTDVIVVKVNVRGPKPRKKIKLTKAPKKLKAKGIKPLPATGKGPFDKRHKLKK